MRPLEEELKREFRGRKLGSKELDGSMDIPLCNLRDAIKALAKQGPGKELRAGTEVVTLPSNDQLSAKESCER